MPAWFETNAIDLIVRALDEDIGPGDITTRTCVPADARATGRFVAKQELIVAGVELLPVVYDLEPTTLAADPRAMRRTTDMMAIAPRIAFEVKVASGSTAQPGDVIGVVSGLARRILERERVALNILQRLTGIATLTRKYVDAVAGTGVTILDTRKTTPGWRRLEKMAVTCGGGSNHRMGLWDALLVKENHVKTAGGIRQAIQAARQISGPVEVEVRNIEELREAIEGGAERVLLDNMTPAQVKECAQAASRAPRPPKVEVSGGVTLATVREYALAGPDFISVGALTHSAPAADISFLL